MDKNQLRIGVIGCGARTRAHLRALSQAAPGQWELSAVMDPSRVNAEAIIRSFGTELTRCYDKDSELLKERCFDGLIIASPNRFHYEHAMAGLQLGIPLLLEKPLATEMEQCARLAEAAERSESPILFGFVLRYTPFYTKVKALADSGRLGRIMTINATESISSRLVLVFTRNWRRSTDNSGPFLLEKCSHDLDICNWLAGSAPVQVSSFANRSAFVPERRPAGDCPDCPEEETCRFSSRYAADRTFDGDMEKALRHTCVYDDLEHPDRQTVSIAYANGVLANFTYAWGQTTARRTMHIMGTDGELHGDFLTGEIRMSYYEGREVKEAVHRTIHDLGSGHGGGDAIIAEAFIRAMQGETSPIKAGVKEGAAAAIVALAAHESSLTGQTVRLE